MPEPYNDAELSDIKMCMMVYMDIPPWSFIAVGQTLLSKMSPDVSVSRDPPEKHECVNNITPNLPIPVEADNNIFDFISYDNPFLTWILDVFM